jgi:dTMP kinase
MAREGLFVVLEGGDGVGKSTQARLLVEHLLAAGHEVVATREPGGSTLGDLIRDELLAGDAPRCALTEMLLFAAARAQHVHELIGPSLRAGRCVVCDRFLGSSIAYQGAGLQVGYEAVRAVNAYATGGLSPDLTIVLDAPVGVAAERLVAERGAAADTIESRDTAFHQRVRNAYLALPELVPGAVVVVDATRSVGAVHEEIAAHVAKCLLAREA